MHLRSWIEISKSNLSHNLSVFKKLTGRTKIACVVKANAYGHGLPEIVSVVDKKTDLFAVDNLFEALQIKKLNSTKPVLILGYIPSFKLKEAIEARFSFVVYNLETLKQISKLKLQNKAKIHLKIETGLNRQGIKVSQLNKFMGLIRKYSQKIDLEGVSTHFANIEDTLDPSFAEFQLSNFKKAIGIIKKAGFNPKYVHTAASAGTLLFKETHFNLVRVGISLYGLWPSRETKIAAKAGGKKFELRPVLTWKSIVAQTKDIKVGESVGYGRTWMATRNTKIAVVPIGYSDGFDRKLSNTGRVIIRGRYAPVIGRVAMNMIMVDVTEIPKIALEDEVIIIGKKAKAEITTEEIADKIDTINYEVISRINPSLPRVII